LLYIVIVLAIDVRALGLIRCHTWFTTMWLLINIAFMFIIVLVYGVLPGLGGTNYMVDVPEEVLKTNKQWLHLYFAVGGVVLITNLARSYWLDMFLPENNGIRAMVVAQEARRQKEDDARLSEPDRQSDER
jgi:hypothetical protein